MRQACRIALILILPWGWCPLGLPAQTVATDTTLEKARGYLAKGDHRQAAAVLEEGLPDASPADRGPIIAQLRQCYSMLIKQSEVAGKAAEAASLREDLEILNAADPVPSTESLAPFRQSPPDPAPRRPTAPVDATTTPSSAPPADLRPLPRAASASEMETIREPAPLQKPDQLPPLSGPEPSPEAQASRTNDSPPKRSGPATGRAGGRPDGRVLDAAPAVASPRSESPASAPEAAPLHAPAGSNAREAEASEASLAQADRLFNAKKYEDAGRAYARMAASNQLPPQRKQVWAYCRWVSVVARINARPRDGKEWDAIEQEIRSIQRLTPGNWYGEYLQNRVAEARKSSRPPGRAGRLVVRGSEPEENAPRKLPRLFGRPRAAGQLSPPASVSADEPSQPLRLPAGSSNDIPSQSAQTIDAPATRADKPTEESPGADELLTAPRGTAEPAAPDQVPSSPAAPAPLAWQIRESANFRIHHMDPVLAEKALAAAEAARTQQARRWGSSATRARWSPACEIYLYPSPRDFAEMTGQPETSPGFSTMGLNGNKVSSRRVNLRADHPQLLTAILPHEVTHVVLADLFTEHQIPRWADEGMAVLAEPLAEQMNRAADLTKPLEEGQVFKLNELMAIDYPNADAWGLYYAQSVSLTQFLVQQGTPEQFIRFVHGSQRGGVEAALREVYRMDGFPELESRWQTFAKRQAAEIAALSRESSVESDSTRRR